MIRFFNSIAGDLYNSNVEDITTEAQASGGGPNISCAFTINGFTSGLLINNCTENGMLAPLIIKTICNTSLNICVNHIFYTKKLIC